MESGNRASRAKHFLEQSGHSFPDQRFNFGEGFLKLYKY